MPRSPAATGSNTPAERLPVNPRRHKVAPEQRKRVATACNNCNIRRVKCSGDRPCLQCISGKRQPCEYPVAVEKVSIPRNELDGLRARCALLERCLQVAEPDAARRQQLLGQDTPPAVLLGGSPSSSVAAPAVEGDTRNPPASTSEGFPTEGRLLTDHDGTSRWLGGTSGASFLDHLKRFIHTIEGVLRGGQPNVPSVGTTLLSSLGRYQTYDSRPLVWPPVQPLELPDPGDADQMLRQVRWFIQDGSIQLSRDPLSFGQSLDTISSLGINYFSNFDTVELQSYYTDLSDAGRLTPARQRRLALYQASFAYASLFGLTTANSKQDGRLGEMYFARALALVGNPLDPAVFNQFSKDDMPALALMALYMIEMNRRDVAYMYVTVAMHLCIMHGVHRGPVDEKEKRVFWTLFCLDRWVSCLMGRPPTILDDAILLKEPVDRPGLPPAVGLRENVKLAKIAGYVVCNTYRIAPFDTSLDTLVTNVQNAMNMLFKWRASLPIPLQISDEQLSAKQFPYDRSLCALHMLYNQLIIITMRPIFFIAVRKGVGQQMARMRDLAVMGSTTREPFVIEDHPQIDLIRSCCDAARWNLALGQHLHQISPGGKLVLQDLHAIFNAAIILLLHLIVFGNARSRDSSAIYFAINMFTLEASAGDTYGKDCASILQELEAIVKRIRVIMFPDYENVDIGGNADTPNIQEVAANMQVPSYIIDRGFGGYDPGQGAEGPVSNRFEYWAASDDDPYAYGNLQY